MEENKNMWIWIIVAAALLLFFGILGMGYGMMGFGWVLMLFFWGLLIWLIVTLVKAAQSSKEKDDPSTILKKRYASGEITKKQYEKIKKEVNR